MTLPAPDNIKHTRRWISKGERNAKGDLLLESINKKRELSFSWHLLQQMELDRILSCTEARLEHTITYYDPYGKRVVSGRYYHTDVSFGVAVYVDGKYVYSGITFAVIEL